MPGIFGIISRESRKKNEYDLCLMIDCMMHENFYVSGKYVNEQMGLYAGWVCHRDSYSDCMPVFNERKDLILLFSGENFLDKEAIEQLKKHDCEFDSSNASYLIHLYEEKGEKFLQHLNGWFSGILIDARINKIVLFNDRYGMQRVYYHESKGDFIFSSEAKALLKIKSELRAIDPKSLGEYFSYDCVLENRTLFPNIFLLPGASKWTFCNAKNIKKEYYFKPSDWEDQPVLHKEVFYNRLRETFSTILPRYFNDTQQIAMSLTSGLDSRAIMSYLNHTEGGLPCYTFGGMTRDPLDAHIARKVADACHQAHHVIRLDEAFLSGFSSFSEKTVYVTDGCYDICGSHDIYLNSYAREIAPVRMTGKFGSEVLGNSSMLKRATSYCKELFHPDFIKYIDEAADTLSKNKKGHSLSFAVFKEIPWHEYGHLDIERSKLTLRTPYMDNSLVKLMYQAPPNTRASKEIRLRLIDDGNLSLRKIMTDRGTAGSYNDFLSKIAQLLYYSLFKVEYVYLWQLPHWLAKLDYIIAPLHPERYITGRYQLGSYRLWFRNELSGYVRDILLDERTKNRSYLNKRFLEKMVYGHIKGEYNYSSEINKTLTAELIHRSLIESI